MHLGSLKTAAAVAEEHGQGLIVVIGGREWPLRTLTVIDQPRDLALCHGHGPEGELLLFNAEQVELVKIQTNEEGRSASLRSFGG